MILKPQRERERDQSSIIPWWMRKVGQEVWNKSVFFSLPVYVHVPFLFMYVSKYQMNTYTVYPIESIFDLMLIHSFSVTRKNEWDKNERKNEIKIQEGRLEKKDGSKVLYRIVSIVYYRILLHFLCLTMVAFFFHSISLTFFSLRASLFNLLSLVTKKNLFLSDTIINNNVSR